MSHYRSPITSHCSLVYLAAVALLLGLGDSLHAQFKKGPYLQNASPQSMTIMWQLSSNEPCTLEYGKIGEGLEVLSPPDNDGLYEVTLSGLTPNFEYSYRIVSTSYASEWYSFSTPPTYTTKLRFTFTSDCEDDGRPYTRMESNLNKQIQYSPDFFLLGGDLVDRGDADGVRFYQDQWSGLLKSVSVLASSRCYWPAVGNHDIDYDYTFSNYLKYHSLPGAEEFYSFRYGSAHVISLSVRGCALYSNQYVWLEEDLARAAADSTIKFIFVFQHFSGYSSGYYNNTDSMQLFYSMSGIPYPDLRRDIYPLFERYRVSVVFGGHDHHYERTHRILDGRLDPNGIQYFIAGGGGSYNLDTRPPQWFTARMSPQRDFPHFLLVDVDGDLCTIRCIPIDSKWGELYDSVTVTAKVPVKYEAPRNAPNAIVLYPTPSRDIVDLFYYGPASASAEYRVFNLLGQELLRGDFSGGLQSGMRLRLDVRNFPTGIYFCRLRAEAMTLQSRFVKVR